MPVMVRWLIGGAIGGLVGAAIWAAVAHYLNVEIGWIAWGVGGLVGIGVAVAGGDRLDTYSGLIALVIAAASVLTGKWVAIRIDLQSLNNELDAILLAPPTDEQLTAHLAYDVADEWKGAGRSIVWPDDADDEDTPLEHSFPNGVWDEASQRLDEMSAEQRAAHVQVVTQDREEYFDDLRPGLFDPDLLLHSITPWDFLWFGLACATAYKLGTGGSDDD